MVQQTSDSGYITGSASAVACYVDSPNNVSVSGGYLHLTVRKEPALIMCPDGLGSFPTQYTSGMVTTDHLFSQADGLFEASAKLPAATCPGPARTTLWLWPNDSRTYVN